MRFAMPYGRLCRPNTTGRDHTSYGLCTPPALWAQRPPRSGQGISAVPGGQVTGEAK